ncbi:MAG: M15 family metallopeptidase [Lachnospiraceae bacterium]
MDKKAKNSLLKSAGFLIVVIILFAALSRTLLSGGQTLSEYAEKNPDLAYGNASEGDTDLPSDATTPDTSADLSAVDTNTTFTGDDNTDANAMDDDRITYQTGFYYEPLSEEYKELITGVSYPAEGAAEINYEDLRYVHVLHCDFDGNSSEGELICNKAIAQDLVEIFYELYLAEYRIEKIALIEDYDGDDNASMADNNTSCFNYRTVDGTDKLSQHAYGLAIDINPFYNPYVRYTKDGGQIVSPEGSEDYADRTSNFPYKIDTSDLCYRLFIEHGFTWGGNWNSSKDYQHFQKAVD